MPKFKKITLRRNNKAGESLGLQFDVQISTEGRFFVALDEEEDSVLQSSLQSVRGETAGLRWLYQSRRGAKMRAEACTFEDLKHWLITAMDDMLSVEKTVERVIVYSHEALFSVWQDPDGALHCNGSASDYDYEDGANWVDGTSRVDSGHRVKHFSLGIAAWVYDKETYTRASASAVKYRSPEWGHSHFDHPTYGAKLNGFTTQPAKPPEELSEMPYTEEAAKFFYDAMMSIAAAGIRFHEFMQDREKLQQRIERGGGIPLLQHTPGE